MEERVTLIKKSFYVLEGDGFFKQTFHVFEQQGGKKYVEELVYEIKDDSFEFQDSPKYSSVREVGTDFVEHVQKVNFGNFYIHGGDHISVANFLKFIFLNSKNDKLNKSVLDVVNSVEVKGMPVCIPREILSSYFDIRCE